MSVLWESVEGHERWEEVRDLDDEPEGARPREVTVGEPAAAKSFSTLGVRSILPLRLFNGDSGWELEVRALWERECDVCTLEGSCSDDVSGIAVRGLDATCELEIVFWLREDDPDPELRLFDDPLPCNPEV